MSQVFQETFRSVRITNSDQKEFNITSSVVELSIFEDIFSNTLSGELVIADGQAVVPSVDIKGQEKLTVEVFRKGEVQILEFFVYSISNRIKTNDSSEVYKLHFTSVETVLNENTRVYSALQGTNSASVETLMKNYIGTKKPFDVDSTTGNHKYVMPSWTPFEAINWYAGRSTSEQHGNYFLFYESLKGFHYKCVEDVMRDGPQVTLHYSPSGNSAITKDWTNIRTFEVLSNNDTLKGFNEEYTTLWTNDIVRKKIVKKRYESEARTNGFGLDLKERRDVFGSEVIRRPESREIHTQNDQYSYDATQKKLGHMRNLFNTKIRAYLIGNRELELGQVVQANFKKSKVLVKGEETKDESLSGKYLVSAIRHIMKPDDYHMSVEIVKE